MCAGSTNFSGQRTAGYTVEGGYYTVVPHPSYFARRNGGLAQVQVLTGSSFGGGFLTPLVSGETVYAVESLTSPLAGGATFTYSSENDRPVGGCPRRRHHHLRLHHHSRLPGRSRNSRGLRSSSCFASDGRRM